MSPLGFRAPDWGRIRLELDVYLPPRDSKWEDTQTLIEHIAVAIDRVSHALRYGRRRILMDGHRRVIFQLLFRQILCAFPISIQFVTHKEAFVGVRLVPIQTCPLRARLWHLPLIIHCIRVEPEHIVIERFLCPCCTFNPNVVCTGLCLSAHEGSN